MKGMNTPWGRADGQGTLAEGIISYSTPSHGGIWLSTERQAQMPDTDNFLHDMRWWEEDCDWSVPYVFFAEDIQRYGEAYKFEENLIFAKELVARYHPELTNK
tara:strand:- start:1213 stop:1521 length:309 start_codon:yes stop_codon:yes gene_type:complete